MMNEIKVNMENLSDSEREQLLGLIEKANKVWKPNKYDNYYTISWCGETNITTFNSDYDEVAYSIGNCFKTLQEAEFMLEKLKVIAELKRFAKGHNEKEIDWKDRNTPKYLLVYSNLSNQIVTNDYYYTKENTVYFTSAEIAEKAITAIGENRLKKYYFEVGE